MSEEVAQNVVSVAKRRGCRGGRKLKMKTIETQVKELQSAHFWRRQRNKKPNLIDVTEVLRQVVLDAASWVKDVDQNALTAKQPTDKETSKTKRNWRKKNAPSKATDVVVDSVQVNKTVAKKKNPTTKPVEQKVKYSRKLKFPDHIDAQLATEILAKQDPKNPTHILGNICINPRYFKHAYIPMSMEGSDLLIVGVQNRNRAMEGDLVVAVIKPEAEWHVLEDKTKQMTGTVICVLEKNHPRKAVGFLTMQDAKLFIQPRDKRMPLIKITDKSLSGINNTNACKDTLFLVDNIRWKKPEFAHGVFNCILGDKSNLTTQTHAILLENDIDVTPFCDSLLNDLPPTNFIPSSTDLEGREDFRQICVITIDPDLAKNLDEAISCTLLQSGNFQVCMHVSDVSHFLKQSSPLDEKVAERATATYLVNDTHFMLPKQLLEVCSLTSGADKLTFSVIMNLTPDGKLVKHRFAKSVINSSCQLSYRQAQEIIDKYVHNLSESDGDVHPTKVHDVVVNLYNLSRKLQSKRCKSGALKIDRPRLCVTLDEETHLPNACQIEERNESCSLVEELAVLANTLVAKEIYKKFPKFALLRSHGEPLKKMLSQTRDLLQKFGVFLNIESSASLQESLTRYQPIIKTVSDETLFPSQTRMMVINKLCAKSMARAMHQCSSKVKCKENLRHYSLNVPLYTYFTSPLRRYADIVVHRLLYASIQGTSMPPEWTANKCAAVAARCNVKESAAANAKEQSLELYYSYFLHLNGPIRTWAIVMDVRKNSANVLLCDSGSNVRIQFVDMHGDADVQFSIEHSVPTVKLVWRKANITQVINMFSIVYVQVEKYSSEFRVKGKILHPLDKEP